MIANKYTQRVHLEADILYSSDKKAYQKKIREIKEDFKDALFVLHKVSDHPKRERCFEIAWEHGHSSGFSEVEIYFNDIVELLKVEE